MLTIYYLEIFSYLFVYRYRIWHYTSSLLVEKFCEPDEELFDIKWKPEPEGYRKVKPTIYTPVPGIKSAAPEGILM